MAKAMNMRHRKEARRAAAEEMAEERSKRSAREQLTMLDQRWGEGMGARKERAKLIAEMLPRIDAAEAKAEMEKIAKKKKTKKSTTKKK